DDRDAAAGPRLGFHARFVLRRIERVAGDPNAVLIAMALGLGILDLAGTTGRLLALPAARSEREESARPGLSGGASRHPAKACIADLCRRLIVRCSIKAWDQTPNSSRGVWAFLMMSRYVRAMKRLTSLKDFSVKELLQRVDRIAGDMNVLLVVIAIGLATLDL